MLVILGLLLLGTGLVLLLDLAGAGRFVISRLTSRNLGGLAPGYAASRAGLRVYATLIGALGAVVIGFAVTPQQPVPGVLAIGAGAAVFVAASVLALIGEVRTYRALPGRDR